MPRGVQWYFVRILAFVASLGVGASMQRYYDVHRPFTNRAVASAPDVRLASSSVEPTSLAAPDYQHEPLWAYGVDRPPVASDTAIPQAPPTRTLRPNEAPAEQTLPRRLPGSNASFTRVDIRDAQMVTDWFPNDHPSMPPVVAHGPAALGKSARACGYCHLATGKGRPENAPISGLPISYFTRQIQDFRNGRRRSADPRKPNTSTMIQLARGISDQELAEAAAYFGSITWTPWTRVVETDLVPKTRIVGNLFLPTEQARTEPIAGRIVEMPEDPEQSETYRNPRSGFVAYVPVGSIMRGKDLVTTGGPAISSEGGIRRKTTACTTCHGPDLLGAADVPPIAGRSPSYMARQLWDMKQGTRNGELAQLMKPVVANLSEQDIVAIAAYVSSRLPFAQGTARRAP
jgi:cytochrome c553